MHEKACCTVFARARCSIWLLNAAWSGCISSAPGLNHENTTTLLLNSVQCHEKI